MVFYKGSFSYSDLQKIPLPEVLEYQEYAERINKEREKQIKRT